ncbi:MAG: 30S ribosomal protein S8 [Nanoarchaeota archaeon]
MSLNDPLASALSKIRNAENVGKAEVVLRPSSKMIKTVLSILNDKMYIGGFEEVETQRGNYLTVNLIHSINNVGVIKPRYAFKITDYEAVEKNYLPAKDFGVIIVTTSEGIMTLQEAKEKQIGGKLVAFCY